MASTRVLLEWLPMKPLAGMKLGVAVCGRCVPTARIHRGCCCDAFKPLRAKFWVPNCENKHLKLFLGVKSIQPSCREGAEGAPGWSHGSCPTWQQAGGEPGAWLSPPLLLPAGVGWLEVPVGPVGDGDQPRAAPEPGAEPSPPPSSPGRKALRSRPPPPPTGKTARVPTLSPKGLGLF